MSDPYQHKAAIQHVFFDNDGTLYPEPDDVKQRHLDAGILALKDMLSNHSEDELNSLIQESRLKHKSSFGIFTHEPYNLDVAELRATHYQKLQNFALKDFFDESASPIAGLASLRIAGINAYIATHGNLDWTHFSTQENSQISRFFNDSQIHTKENSPGMKGKNEGIEFYTSMLERMGIPRPENIKDWGRDIALVDDQLANLLWAKELGMMTILIDKDGQYSQEEKASYVDIISPNATESIYAIHNNNLNLQPQPEQTTENRASVIKESPLIPVPLKLTKAYCDACESQDLNARIATLGQIMSARRYAVEKHYEQGADPKPSPQGNSIDVKS
jgi:FMN phosphatase YigB (HAD superfamily)